MNAPAELTAASSAVCPTNNESPGRSMMTGRGCVLGVMAALPGHARDAAYHVTRETSWMMRLVGVPERPVTS